MFDSEGLRVRACLMKFKLHTSVRIPLGRTWLINQALHFNWLIALGQLSGGSSEEKNILILGIMPKLTNVSTFLRLVGYPWLTPSFPSRPPCAVTVRRERFVQHVVPCCLNQWHWTQASLHRWGRWVTRDCCCCCCCCCCCSCSCFCSCSYYDCCCLLFLDVCFRDFTRAKESGLISNSIRACSANILLVSISQNDVLNVSEPIDCVYLVRNFVTWFLRHQPTRCILRINCVGIGGEFCKWSHPHLRDATFIYSLALKLVAFELNCVETSKLSY